MPVDKGMLFHFFSVYKLKARDLFLRAIQVYSFQVEYPLKMLCYLQDNASLPKL